LIFTIDEVSQYQAHFAFDSLFDFPLQRAIECVFAFQCNLETFVSPFNQGTGILEKDTSYTNHHRLVTLLDNHDLSSRFFSTVLTACGNNRDAATRVYMLTLSFMFTIRGIPQLFYGNEVGLEGGSDPDNRRDFEWHKFDKNYDVLPEYTHEKLIFDHTCKLIKIRKKHHSLSAGSFICLYVDPFLLVYLRHHEKDVTITIIHNGWQKAQNPISISFMNNPYIPSRIKTLLANSTMKCQLTNEKFEIKEGTIEVWPEWKSAHILSL